MKISELTKAAVLDRSMEIPISLFGQTLRITLGQLLDLATSQPAAVKVRYSTDGNSWHDDFQGTDRWMSISTDGGVTWGGAIPINATDGQPGAAGATLYTWIKYSDVLNPSLPAQIYDVPTADTRAIGLAFNKPVQTESPNPAEYRWSALRGNDGRGITGVGEYYAVHSSATTAPPKGMFVQVPPSAMPAMTRANRYLWNFERTQYSDGTSVDTDPAVVGRMGADGAGVASVVNYYLASARDSGVTSADTADEQWTTDASVANALFSEQRPYMWNYEVTTYTNSRVENTDPHIIGRYGKDGQSVYLLNLDNEMDSVPCDSDANPVPASYACRSGIRVFYGTKDDTASWAFSVDNTYGCSASIDADGKLVMTGFTEMKCTATVVARKQGCADLYATMKANKVMGEGGKPPVIYSIEPTASTISVDAAGTMRPATIGARVKAVKGNLMQHLNYGVVKYLLDDDESTRTVLPFGSIPGNTKRITPAATTTSVTFELYDPLGTTLLDTERVPVVRDGSDGDITVDRGPWTLGESYFAGDVNPATGKPEISDVWRFGSRWRCPVTAVAAQNADGSDNGPGLGKGWKFISGAGMKLEWADSVTQICLSQIDRLDYTKTVVVYYHGEDVTDHCDSFVWGRRTIDAYGNERTALDAAWNAAQEQTPGTESLRLDSTTLGLDSAGLSGLEIWCDVELTDPDIAGAARKVRRRITT